MVIERRGPVRFGTLAEQQRHDLVDEGPRSESWLGVPILAGETAVGVLVVESMTQHAYSDSDDALLSTIASSMGVALENARLFGETKRLLTETDERAAELAIINEVQRGLAERLDMQAMYDVVGDKLQEIFDAQVVDIGVVDRDASQIRFWYTIERGVRFPDEPMAIEGPRARVLETREPLVINERANEQVLAMVRAALCCRETRPVRRLRTAGRGRRGSRRDQPPEPRP